MKRTLLLATTCLVAALTYAAPTPSGQWELRATVRPYADLGQTLGSMYNCRTFDGAVYANQIGSSAHRCFARYPSGSSTMAAGVVPAINEHRMVAPFRGAYKATYMLGTGGANTEMTTFATTFTEYTFDGYGAVTAETIDGQVVESFDWVDEDTIISTCYMSGQRKKLYLTDVTAEPFTLTRNTSWNPDGYITSAATTRIRNVRVGETYTNYAYYGDNGAADNPKVYALNLTTGVEKEIGTWNGSLKAGTAGGAATGSWGLWTVVERGGYLYLQSSDDGIQVFSMTDATTMGALVTSYSKAELDAATGGTPAYYGFDVAPDGARLLLGGYTGCVYELQKKGAPYLPNQLQLRVVIDLAADLGIAGNSIFNPRFFDGLDYINQINVFGFGVYPSGSPVASVLVTNTGVLEHRMLAPFRGALRSTYLLASSQGYTPVNAIFSRYDFNSTNRVDATTPDSQTAEGFDWVDDDTIIYTVYSPSGNRKRLYLVDVVAEPFALNRNTAWNPDGYITTGVSTRIRNVRVGDVYSGYAYYGDGNVNSSPNFYAVNLATGAETLLGNAGELTGGGSYGLWTVLERGGFLYVQTTDNGIQVYNLSGPTKLGVLHAVYDRITLDSITGYYGQCWGLDVTPDNKRLLLSATGGRAYELGPPSLSIARSGTDVLLSWPLSVTAVAIQASTSLAATNFADLDPQPIITPVEKFNSAQLPATEPIQFFRLRRTP